MLRHPTLDQLHALGLHGMAKAFADLADADEARDLAHADWLALLLDRETSWRRDKRLTTRLRTAKLRQQASVEDVDYRTARGLDRALVNAGAIFLKSGAAKFPSLAGWRSAVGVIGASVLWRPAATPQGRRNGIGGGVRLEADRLGQEVGVLAQPIAGALDLDDDGVMKKPVEECGGDDGIAEDVAPFAEAAV